jgi:hypothetical protein
MKKILFTIALLTILTAGCSKKENSSKNGNALKQFDTDEAFSNRKSYNLVKNVIDNSIPYAQMICINPHSVLHIKDIDAVKSKIIKIQNAQYIIYNNTNDLPPTIYKTFYYRFNELGFIDKIYCYNWTQDADTIQPISYSSSEYNLTNFGIEAVHRKNGEPYDKYTIIFENKDSGINLKAHNGLTARITNNAYEDATHKTTFEPGEEIYRFDDYEVPGNYTIYKDGIMIKAQEGKYLYYIEGNTTTKVNLETGEKETNSEEIISKKITCGIPIYTRIIKEEDDTLYIEKTVEVLDDYDKDFFVCSILMPEDKDNPPKPFNKSSE